MRAILSKLSFSILTVFSTVLTTCSAVFAAEQIILKYKIFEASVSVQDLTRLAETGEASSELEAYMNLASQDPQEVRKTLTQEVQVNPLLFDRALNNPLGEVILDRLGQIIRTPSGEANRQALRSALVLSALPDGKLTLIEVIQKYPTSEVHVEGERLLEAVDQIGRIERVVRDVNDLFQGLF